MNIYPTHTCFDDALDFITNAIRRDHRAAMRYRLVHGICLTPEGEPFAHAWVKDMVNMEAIEHGLLRRHPACEERIAYSMDYGEHHTTFQVQEQSTYTIPEAWAENARTGHYGPWLERYRALTSDRGKPKAKPAPAPKD